MLTIEENGNKIEERNFDFIGILTMNFEVFVEILPNLKG